MGNSLKQSQSVITVDRRDASVKALRSAVKHKAKVTVIRRLARPAHALPRRSG